ncbi:uncharacterized protein N7496_011071 [Penicillium cataractarum]|uniref:Uncharacterized protein n=1 Tax=Penicillium cataractarum TaxID=2100454 RepID=A0A9W9UV47_9EURO|nr:uncharacterized protein N7496_011071 [Penicillium cataractarum]KAJ5358658.1 hypothetical protein N7496_011071 [Penicillium cataractarum]
MWVSEYMADCDGMWTAWLTVMEHGQEALLAGLLRYDMDRRTDRDGMGIAWLSMMGYGQEANIGLTDGDRDNAAICAPAGFTKKLESVHFTT